MRLTELRSVRMLARVVVLVLPLVGVVLLARGCTAPLDANGQACLKSSDCASGICSQLVCAAAPPLTDAELEAEPSEGGTTDATTDGAADAPVADAPPETAAAETGSDAAGE